jgi:hypothetical protein
VLRQLAALAVADLGWQLPGRTTLLGARSACCEKARCQQDHNDGVARGTSKLHHHTQSRHQHIQSIPPGLKYLYQKNINGTKSIGIAG